MSKKTKRILTGHVARIINGVLVAAGPGDLAPDWVTNPDLIADGGSADTTPAEPTGVPAGSAPSGDPAGDPGNTPAGDDLDEKKGDELKAIAEGLEISKSGSKPELIARIRAKRAEAEPISTPDATGREALVEKAKSLGVDNADDLTDAELLTVVDTED